MTFQAKAYGWNQKGASMFEMHPYYPHDIGIFGPSIFFNNYGLRTFHPDSGIVSWNWCAPYYLGCNTICVNGNNSIALASLVLGQERLDMIRDQMWVEMKRLMVAPKEDWMDEISVCQYYIRTHVLYVKSVSVLQSIMYSASSIILLYKDIRRTCMSVCVKSVSVSCNQYNVLCLFVGASIILWYNNNNNNKLLNKIMFNKI